MPTDKLTGKKQDWPAAKDAERAGGLEGSEKK
jgi:hypothetical protein